MIIAYVCNRQKQCCKSNGCVCNGGDCSHTLDINYSKNFKEVPIVTDNPLFILINSPDSEAKYFEEE